MGKTTLLEAVHARLPAYQHVEEPYRWLEDEGHEFSDPPSAEDFERQLRRSIDSIAESSARTLFDRCPLDPVATLDLVVLVSIETPDRITLSSHEDRRLRRRVDDRLRTLLLDDPYGFDTEVLEVAGPLDNR